MKILALDIATNTGWARNYGPEPRVGSVSFERPKATKTRPSLPIGYVYSRLDRWIVDLYGGSLQLRPDIVVVEEPIGGGGGMSKLKVCIGLWAVVNTSAFNCGITIMSVKNSDLKRSFIGLANATKEDMIAMAKRHGYDPRNDDEADACLLLEYTKQLKGVKD